MTSQIWGIKAQVSIVILRTPLASIEATSKIEAGDHLFAPWQVLIETGITQNFQPFQKSVETRCE